MSGEPGSAESDAEPPGGQPPDQGPAILFVEDDDGLRLIVARHLRRHGYRVTEAASAEDARRALSAGFLPALVVLDVNLPGDNGWDLLRSPDMRLAGSPPVVIASAVTVSPGRLAEFDIAGYLPKPFPLETLLQIVERQLRRPRDPDSEGRIPPSTEEGSALS
jgi:DNA-binding response OmpR family regulator